jgi:hypothetical protein
MMRFVQCVADWLSANGAWIIAVAALVIATVQARLANKGFRATHRPRVVVRFIEGPTVDATTDLGTALVTLANIGVSWAEIIAVRCDLAFRDKNLQWLPPGLDTAMELKPVVPVHLISGGRHIVPAYSRSGEDVSFSFDLTGVTTFDPPTDQLCIVGEVRYRDKNRVTRDMGFFRIYNPKNGNWIRDKDSDHEYQD